MAQRPFHRKLLKYENEHIEHFGSKQYRRYRDYRINVGKGTDEYNHCYIDILDKLIDHLETERKRFNPLFIGRFDITFPSREKQIYDPDSFSVVHPDMVEQQEMMTSFLNNLKKYLSKKTVDKTNPLRNHDRVKVGWVREYGSDKGWHYHYYICLDATKVDKWKPELFNLVDDLWEKASGTHYKEIHINSDNNRKDNKNCWIITPDKKGNEQMEHAIYALSYLAKLRDKRDKKTVKHLATHSIPNLPTVTKEQRRQAEWVNDVLQT